MDKLQKFLPLVKVDEAQRIVYGLVTAERRDKDGETCHYDSTKAEYVKVSNDLGKASDGQNIMPLREMHQLNAVGAGKSITFDDPNKQILMAFKVVDDSTWKKVVEKVLLGFSQGGRYIKKWTEGSVNFYTAQPGEVSLVDNPCLPGAYIEYAKAEGGVEFYRAPGSDDYARKADVSELHTELKEIRVLLGAHAHNVKTGEAMKPEQIKKCAEALGITEEEFGKRFIDADEHEKIKKALVDSEKNLADAQALAKADKKEDAPEFLTKSDAQKIVDDAVTKAVKEALDKLPAKDEASKARLVVTRDGNVRKVDSAVTDPIPV